MKRPIASSEIRKGDLIRWEDGENAHEYRAVVGTGKSNLGGAYFLLDRPEPAIELPTEPTLGWATVQPKHWRESITCLHEWRHRGGQLVSTVAPVYFAEDITAFTPATAIPSAALGELRRNRMVGSFNFAGDIDDFLRAVDEVDS